MLINEQSNLRFPPRQPSNRKKERKAKSSAHVPKTEKQKHGG